MMEGKKEYKLFNNFLNKNIYIRVNISNGERVYSGILLEANYIGKTIEGTENYFLLIEDKFGAKVGVMSSQIKLIEEEK